MLLHAGTNIVNEVYDVRKGIDTITSPRASHAIVKGRMTERTALAHRRRRVRAGGRGRRSTSSALRGPAIVVLGLLGLVGGWGYTAPPLEYKYRALGVPLVFLLMGPLMVVGAYFAVSGDVVARRRSSLSIPVGLLVAAILHGNEWRDIREDTPGRDLDAVVADRPATGRTTATSALVLGAYIGPRRWRSSLGVLPPPDDARDPVAAVPRPGHPVGRARRDAARPRAIAMIDLQTARLHLAFGALLVVGHPAVRASVRG